MRLALANRLIFNSLQNVPFWIVKRHVLEPETARIAVQNGTFGNTKRHVWKIK